MNILPYQKIKLRTMRIVLLGILLCLLPLTKTVQAQILARKSCYSVCCCQSKFLAGKEDGNLQVHVSGEKKNRLEIFLQDNYYLDELSGLVNLHCCASFSLAKPGEFGTFAMRYGKCCDKFVAYGVFKNRKLIKITNDHLQLNSSEVGLVNDIDPDHPISMTWVTKRVLKIEHGKSGSKTKVLKFFGCRGRWLLV